MIPDLSGEDIMYLLNILIAALIMIPSFLALIGVVEYSLDKFIIASTLMIGYIMLHIAGITHDRSST